MSHQETKVTYFARPAGDRREAYLSGVTGAEPDYGKVNVVRKTRTETVADGDRHRVLDFTEAEEVLLTLDTEEAVQLARSLPVALVNALQVRPGEHNDPGYYFR